MNKPNQQTLVVPAMIPLLLAPLPVGRVRGLGGDFGERLQRDLGITTVGEVAAVSKHRLEALYGKSTADWLWHLVRGMVRLRGSLCLGRSILSSSCEGPSQSLA